jgi:hypothetical protein
MTFSGLDCLRLLSAFQALEMPSGFYGVSHKQARSIVADMTGKKVRGRPSGQRSLADYLEWHFGRAVVEVSA